MKFKGKGKRNSYIENEAKDMEDYDEPKKWYDEVTNASKYFTSVCSFFFFVRFRKILKLSLKVQSKF